jgi:putative oxidoreductase
VNKPAGQPGPQTVRRAIILVRLMVGGVFLVEGLLKFLYPAELGAGRFARIAIPAPAVMGPFVSGVETVCGALVLLGLFTRLAAIPLLIDISVAIISTKVPILLGHGLWGFSLAKLPHYGFLSMVHEARTDFSMWLGLVFLLVVGGGSCSLDALRAWLAPEPKPAGGDGHPAQQSSMERNPVQ